MAKKFEIIETSPPYNPDEAEEINMSADIYITSDFNEDQDISHRLYINEEAKNQIFQHIGWAQKTTGNVFEQGGILLGTCIFDKKEKITYGIVERAVPGKSARGHAAYLELNHQAWKEMIDYVDELLDNKPEVNLQIVGWYHTHPNSLGVFMSGTDRATQRRMFGQSWQFAIVLNPHKQIWKAFHGKNSEECKGFMLNEAKTV